MELKGGDTYNGRLASCDSWMNMNLTDVICTSKDGDRFWKLPTCYIRGSAIKYLRLPPDLLDKAKQQGADDEHRGFGGRGRGRGGRGGGRGGRGGRGEDCFFLSYCAANSNLLLLLLIFIFIRWSRKRRWSGSRKRQRR